MILIKYAGSIILTLALSCTQSSKHGELQPFNDTIVNNKLVKYAGDLMIKDPHKEAEFYQSFGEFLELPKIAESSSDMSVRIWLWGDSVHYVVNFQRDRSSYSGDLIAFYPTNAGSRDFNIRHKVVNLKPLSGWDAVSPSLKAFEELVSGDTKTSGLTVLKGMRSVKVEMKDKGKYRYVKFLQPSYYWKVNKDILTVHKFLTTLAKEFKIANYPPAERTFEEIY